MTGESERRDADHLRLLVSAAVVYALVRAAVMLVMLLETQGNWRFAAGAMVWLLGWPVVLIALVVCAGVALHKRRGRWFVLCVAFLACTEMPLGTVFGVLTILVLSRPSVADLFSGHVARWEPPRDSGVGPPAAPG